MKFRYAALLLVVGCATAPRPNSQPRWLLLASPPTMEYPEGSIATPLSRWSDIGEYASVDGCEASIQVTANRLQLPMECVASDDPRLNGAMPARVAAR